MWLEIGYRKCNLVLFTHTLKSPFLSLKASTELCCLRHMTCTDRTAGHLLLGKTKKKKTSKGGKKATSEETFKPQTTALITLLVNTELPQ